VDGRIGLRRVTACCRNVEKLHSARDALCSRFCSIDAVSSVMFRCAAQVPSVEAVHGPRVSAVGCFIYQYLRAGGHEGSFIVVESSVELNFRREGWVDP
jgi:hypothetical protein